MVRNIHPGGRGVTCSAVDERTVEFASGGDIVGQVPLLDEQFELRVRLAGRGEGR
jgi:hypothetical protein